MTPYDLHVEPIFLFLFGLMGLSCILQFSSFVFLQSGMDELSEDGDFGEFVYASFYGCKNPA